MAPVGAKGLTSPGAYVTMTSAWQEQARGDAAAAQQKARQAQRSVNVAEVDHRPGQGSAAA